MRAQALVHRLARGCRRPRRGAGPSLAFAPALELHLDWILDWHAVLHMLRGEQFSRLDGAILDANQGFGSLTHLCDGEEKWVWMSAGDLGHHLWDLLGGIQQIGWFSCISWGGALGGG